MHSVGDDPIPDNPALAQRHERRESLDASSTGLLTTSVYLSLCLPRGGDPQDVPHPSTDVTGQYTRPRCQPCTRAAVPCAEGAQTGRPGLH